MNAKQQGQQLCLLAWCSPTFKISRLQFRCFVSYRGFGRLRVTSANKQPLWRCRYRASRVALWLTLPFACIGRKHSVFSLHVQNDRTPLCLHLLCLTLPYATPSWTNNKTNWNQTPTAGKINRNCSIYQQWWVCISWNLCTFGREIIGVFLQPPNGQYMSVRRRTLQSSVPKPHQCQICGSRFTR